MIRNRHDVVSFVLIKSTVVLYAVSGRKQILTIIYIRKQRPHAARCQRISMIRSRHDVVLFVLVKSNVVLYADSGRKQILPIIYIRKQRPHAARRQRIGIIRIRHDVVSFVLANSNIVLYADSGRNKYSLWHITGSNVRMQQDVSELALSAIDMMLFHLYRQSLRCSLCWFRKKANTPYSI